MSSIIEIREVKIKTCLLLKRYFEITFCEFCQKLEILWAGIIFNVTKYHQLLMLFTRSIDRHMEIDAKTVSLLATIILRVFLTPFNQPGMVHTLILDCQQWWLLDAFLCWTESFCIYVDITFFSLTNWQSGKLQE